MGPGSDPTTAGPGPTAASNGTLDTTAGDPSGDPTSDTDPPVGGCDALPPPEGTVCHDVDPLDLPPGCEVPRPVLMANVNGDGHDDVLVACDGGPLLMFLGQQQGVGAPQQIGPAGDLPVDIAVDQLDGEGGVDIVVINEVADDGVRIFFAEGDSSFSAPVFVDPGANPTSVATGPWFGGMFPDILVTLPEADVVARLVSDEARVFTAGQALFVPALDPFDVAMGQLDGKGGVDIAVASPSTNTVSLFFNMGKGMESPPLEFDNPPLTLPNQLLLNDVEPNGSLDILYTRGGQSSVSLLRSLGGGMFEPSASNHGVEVVGLDDGDFDGNGRPDAVVADHDGAQLIFLMLRDDMNMTIDVVAEPVEGTPWSIAAGNLDGDGLSDVVVSFDDINEVAIVQSSPAP